MRPQPIIPAILGVSLITASLSAQSPKVNESGHTLTLFADTPDIVTPIGMAVDKNDQVFVIESHTPQSAQQLRRSQRGHRQSVY